MILRALAAAVALLPWRSLGALGHVLGVLAGSLLRVRRRVVEGAIRAAGLTHPARVARRAYAGLGAGVFELLWLAGASRSRRDRIVEQHVTLEPELEATIEAALAKGPVVFAASHTGNWELAAHAAARLVGRHGRGLMVVAKPMALAGFDAFCRRLREGLGISLASPKGAVTTTAAALARGDAVAMMIDQVPDHPRHGVWAPFLGRPALCDRAPAAIARRAGATFIVVAAKRRGRRHVVTLLEAHDARERNVVELTRSATAALDRFVRAEPPEWLWLHRRWKEPRATRASLALVARGFPG
ncbi:MAG: lysophospholipid acyltransferase family protein [Deltaproteobacteria bacterium]|nr:lysophospholipid acyltransferase family protein [Deltaproteobacteria bacterium]